MAGREFAAGGDHLDLLGLQRPEEIEIVRARNSECPPCTRLRQSPADFGMQVSHETAPLQLSLMSPEGPFDIH